MPRISEKATAMPQSPIRKLVPLANAAKGKGIKIYHLNIGQPDIETPAEALEAVQEAHNPVVAYSDSAGNLSFRKGLVEYYGKLGIRLDPSEMIVTNGGSEAILLAFATCMDKGDEIIIPEPFYANYNGFAAQSEIKVVPVPSHIECNFALPSIEDFEKRITPRTRAIAVCNPNNPTGYLYSRREIEQLGEIARKHDLYILSDEVYREFCYDGHEHFSVMQLSGLEENVILLDSVSKRYSLCGARVGVLISRNKKVISSVMKFAQARLCPPYYGQIAAEGALQAPPSYFKAVYDEYVARRNCMVEVLNRIPGVHTPTPGGAFYTVASLPVEDADEFAAWLLTDFNYEGETVMIAPASGFYATPGLGKNEARLAYVLKKEDLLKAAKILEEALKVYPKRTN